LFEKKKIECIRFEKGLKTGIFQDSRKRSDNRNKKLSGLREEKAVLVQRPGSGYKKVRQE